MQGFGKRWGALIADQETKRFFETFLLPTLLHQDPRYFRMGAGHHFSHATCICIEPCCCNPQG